MPVNCNCPARFEDWCALTSHLLNCTHILLKQKFSLLKFSLDGDPIPICQIVLQDLHSWRVPEELPERGRNEVVQGGAEEA